MFRSLLLAVGYVALSAGAANPVREPVLVELFTSEGCSSCPPADRLLEQVDSQAIVLSEHVDYWDHQGWKDKFSSHAFTERQENYARQFGLDGPYTPQMVVDGAAEYVGSDTSRTAQEIDKASHRPKAQIHVERTGQGINLEISGAPNAADVMLALADDSDTSRVLAGENKGRELHHVAVVRSLRKVGSVKRGGSFAGKVALPGDALRQRVVVFLQEPGQLRVYGAALLPARG